MSKEGLYPRVIPTIAYRLWEAIEEFRQICEKEFGEPMSHAESRETGTRLMELFEMICMMPPVDDHSANES